MKHTYLTTTSVHDALVHHAITEKEAEKLTKKIQCQEKIYRAHHN
ncbi:hypothetical protein [Sulfurimonas sp.]